MASAPARDATLPPLIRERVGDARRLVVLATASHETLDLARSLAADEGVDLVVSAGVGAAPAVSRMDGDLLVHGVPDLFGRLLDEPAGWEAVVVVSRLCGPWEVGSRWRIDTGDAPAHPIARLSAALATLDRHLRQQRRVRPLFADPPALALPYVAPDGITLPGAFGRLDFPRVPGLPDLVVVRPHGDPATVS